MFDKSQLDMQTQSVIMQQKSCPGCMSPYLLVVIFSYVKLASVLVYGCELFMLINLTGSSDSPQPLKTIKPWLLLPQTCPLQHALLTPFTVCLFVLWLMGRPFDSFLPTLKPLAANQITWDTENSLSQGCGPPTAHAPAPGRACTPHTSYSVRVRGYAVIIYLTVTYTPPLQETYMQTRKCKFVLSANRD